MKFGPNGYEAADGSLTHEEYLKLSPMGYVPTLTVDGSTITEVPAILQYIASFAQDRQLMGADLMGTVRVEEWLVWLSGLHAVGFGALWRPARFVGDAEEMYPVVRETGRKEILRRYGRIESQVGYKHAVGEHFTVVDFYLHTFWRWGVDIGVDMAAYPRFTAVVRKVEKLGSVQAAMKEEGQPLRLVDA